MSLVEQLRGRRVGVALSSAFFGFYAHTGFVRAVRRLGIEPVMYGGTSAGALVAAFAAADGLAGFGELLGRLRRRDFWDPALGLGGRPFGLLHGRRFGQLLETHLPVPTFEGCRVPLVTVSTNLTRRCRHVDTRGPLAPAVLASCALPLMFRPVVREGDLHVDGGLIDKVPLRAMIDADPALDALLVHVLPSSGLEVEWARGPLGFLDQALDLVRDDGWRQQVDLARARGVAVHVVTTRPPRVGPFTMARGADALRAAEQQAEALLRSD